MGEYGDRYDCANKYATLYLTVLLIELVCSKGGMDEAFCPNAIHFVQTEMEHHSCLTEAALEPEPASVHAWEWIKAAAGQTLA